MRKIALLVVLAAGCTSETLPPSNVIFLSGHESDLWTRDPAPARIEVNLLAGDQRIPLGEAPTPTTGLTISNRQVPPNTSVSFEAQAFDGASAVVARGSGVPFVLDSLEALTIPLFVARTGGWSRPPDTLEHPHRKPVVISAFPEFVIVAGGDPLPGVDGSIPDFYDVAIWATRRSQPPLPRAPKSAGIAANQLLTIDDTGASWLDLPSNASADAQAPEGLSFGEVSGGDTVTLADGTSFFVGATRSTGEPTSKVLRIGADRTLRALALTTPRLGAAAGAVGNKLVIAGGSTMGAGVEVLNDQQSAFVTLGIAAEATTGLGLAAVDGTTMLLAGGKDPVTGAGASVRTLDVSCAAACTASDLGPLPSALSSAHVFRIDKNKLLVTGESDDGEAHAFSVATGGPGAEIVERPLRERRKRASAVRFPNGLVGLLGGVSIDGAETPILTFETYVP